MNIQNIIDQGKIVDYRNFTFRDQITVVEEEWPIRCGVTDGELETIEPETLDYQNAPYELRYVSASETPAVPAPCLLLFHRVIAEL